MPQAIPGDVAEALRTRAAANRRVLLVDDPTERRERAPALLEHGLELETAESFSEALERCVKRGPFAVLVADQDLPGVDGLELLREVKRAWPSTSRIMVTGTSQLEVAVRAIHEGEIFRFLSKPTSPVALYDAVAAGIDHHRHLEEERLLTEHLRFSQETLLSLTETLEQRLAEQVIRMRMLQELSSKLNAATTSEEVSRVALMTLSKLLLRRSVTLRLRGAPEHAELVRTVGGRHSTPTWIEPVLSMDGVIGSFEVDELSPGGQALTGADRQILASVAAAVATASRGLAHRRERDDAHHATVLALARLAEYRDDETGRHLERVCEYCRLLAEGLRDRGTYARELTREFIEDLVLSAPLHDIGKVGIPDAILRKPGRLDEGEWEVMRRHPTIGAETIRNVIETSGGQSYLVMALDIAWCHHEKWDGSGYPRGIGGQEIPLAARLMSLGDCYDALTTRRSYKEPWTHADAADYIRAESGAQFDPEVVAVFAELERRFDEIRQRLADAP